MNIQDIQKLIDKYMDGETNHVEELQLRDYFRTATVIPEDWKSFKALFLFVDEEAKEDVLTPKRAHISHYKMYAAIAASLLLLVAMTFAVIGEKGGESVNKCFAVIDGKTITNQTEVEKEAEQALQLVSINDVDAFGALDELQMPLEEE